MLDKRSIGRAALFGSVTFMLAACTQQASQGPLPTTGLTPSNEQQARPSALTSMAASQQNLAVNYTVGSLQSPVHFNTIPGATCQVAGDKSTEPWRAIADTTGAVLFYVSIPNRTKTLTQDLICTEGTRSARVAITYRPGPVEHLNQSPILVPSEAKMEAFAAVNGFDPRTAPNSVLVAHNLPPRPDDFATNPHGSVGWLKAAFSPITSLVTSGVTVPGVYAGLITGVNSQSAPPAIAAGSNQLIDSNNWSGYDAEGSQGTYNTVRGYWHVPRLSATGSANPSNSSLWVGIDGGGFCAHPPCSGNVFQDGTEQDFKSVQGVNMFLYYGWWEEYPNNAEQALFQVSPGDEMYGTFWKNTKPPVYGQYYLKDLTTGRTSNFAIQVGGALVGDSVEWILETPSVNGKVADLPNYGTAEMTEAETISGNTTLFYNQIPGASSYTLYQVFLAKSILDSTAAPNGTGNITYTWYGTN